MSEKLKEALERIAAIGSERANDIYHSQEIRYSQRAIRIAEEALADFIRDAEQAPPPSTDGMPILRGVGKMNGDGWKDSTKKGEIVFVWNREHPKPYAAGQYPRVGRQHWSASTEQYDFRPATIEEIQALFADLAPQTNLTADPSIQRIAEIARAILAEAPPEANEFDLFKDCQGKVWPISLKNLRAIASLAATEDSTNGIR